MAIRTASIETKNCFPHDSETKNIYCREMAPNVNFHKSSFDQKTRFEKKKNK